MSVCIHTQRHGCAQVYERKRPPPEEQATEPRPMEDAAPPSEEQAPVAEAPPPAKKRGRYAPLLLYGRLTPYLFLQTLCRP